MPIGAALGAAGGSIGSALIGSSAASSAASQQVAAEQAALQTQQQMFNETRHDLSPYRQTGASALSTIDNMYGLAGSSTPGTQNFSAFTNSPDYQFALQQGNQSVDRTAAAGGQLMSGGQLKAAQEFGQGLASQQFSNYYNRLAGLAGLGESAAAQTGQLSSSFGSSMSALQGQMGASQASGTLGSANALSGGMSALAGYLMPNNRPVGSSYTSNNNGSALGGSNNSGFGALSNLGAFQNTFSGGLLSSIF